MIQNDAQRERTLIKIAEFRRALERISAAPMNKRSTTIKASYEEIIGQLEDELREYNRSKSAN